MRTPGTRRTWSDGREWAAHAWALVRNRGTSAKVYKDLDAHLEALEVAIIDIQDRVDLLAIRAVVDDRRIKPGRGRRAGSHYERIIVAVNNALQRRTAPIGRQPRPQQLELAF